MSDPGGGGAPACGREIAVVRVALAVIALHVLDDAFVHPEPGTAAADHLASGLVPVAIALCLALAYPRLPAWWQSVLAGGVGVLAIVAAVELWKIPEASHTGRLSARPREYERRVVSFLDRHLLGS